MRWKRAASRLAGAGLRRRALCLLAALGSLAGSGCIERASAPAGTWVSRPAGSDVWLAVTVKNGRAAAFVCGGEESLETHTRWMTASAETDDLRFDHEGWSLSVTLSRDSASGELVDPDGETMTVIGLPTDDNDLSGLYTAVDSGCRDGVIIVFEDGEAKAQGAWCSSSGEFAQVTPGAPLELQPDGLHALAHRPEGDHPFVLNLAVPAEIEQVASPSVQN